MFSFLAHHTLHMVHATCDACFSVRYHHVWLPGTCGGKHVHHGESCKSSLSAVSAADDIECCICVLRFNKGESLMRYSVGTAYLEAKRVNCLKSDTAVSVTTAAIHANNVLK
jgi:hypothetical protein